MKRSYLSKEHRKISEACQKEVLEMGKHPLSFKEKLKQIEENHQRSILPTESEK